MNDHAGDDRGHGWKPQAHQKRNGNRRRGSKTSGPFDERAKQPGNENHLNAGVRGKPGKPLADHPDGTALLKRMQQQNSPENNVKKASRDDQTLETRSHDLQARDLPYSQRQPYDGDIGKRHGSAGRPSEAYQKKDHDAYGTEGKQSTPSRVHRGFFLTWLQLQGMKG